MCPLAGVKLAPGNYSVQPNSNQGHIYLTCSATRTAAFKIDLSNTVLTFTVRPPHAILPLRWPAAEMCPHIPASLNNGGSPGKGVFWAAAQAVSG